MFIRRLSTVASGAAAFIALSVIPATAGASAGGSDELQACLGGTAGREGGYIGVCSSYYRSSNNAAAATAYFCRTFIVPAGFFAAQGECVSVIGPGGITLVP